MGGTDMESVPLVRSSLLGTLLVVVKLSALVSGVWGAGGEGHLRAAGLHR